MGLFVRKSNSPSDKYGQTVYYVDDNGFVRRSVGPSDKYGLVVYYVDNDGFVRKSSGPNDKYGQIVYYVDDNGFIRKSNGPSDKYGSVVYYVGNDGFVRKSNGPSDKYGAIAYYVEKEKEKEEKPELNQAQGVMLAIAFVVGLLFAPILIVLGMFGKFLLGGIYINALPINAFKKFRKIYTIINLVWMGLALVAIIVLAILQSEAITIVLYSLAGGNVVLFILSLVIGNKIYNEHKHELPQPIETPLSAEEVESVEDANNDIVSQDISQEETKIELDDSDDDYITKELYKYKKLLNNGLIDEKEYKNLKNALFRKVGISSTDNLTSKIGLLWFFNIFNFIGIFTNMIVALSFGGLRYMYEYILSGFIAGFCFVLISVPFIIWLATSLKKHCKENKSAKIAVIGGQVSIAVAAFIMIIATFL